MFTPTTTTPQAMLTEIATAEGGNSFCRRPVEKISVIGAGTVGAAIAYTLLVQDLCNELVLIDTNEALARGEALDMTHARMFLNSPRISASADYSAAVSSRIIIITAGVRNFDDTKDVATRQNAEIFREIIPQVVMHASQAIIIVCSYPVDEMSYVAWKLSGLSPHKVIGVGTYLETCRLREAIACKMHVHSSCVRAMVIGEHGSQSIPLWSSVNVAGVRLTEINPDIGSPQDPEDWNSLFTELVDSAEEVDCLKECGTWGMGLCVARIVRAIMHDTGECFTISTHIQGCRHGIDKDVYLSLPVIIGCNGVKNIIKQNLNEDEKEALQKSADRMFELLKSLSLDALEAATIDC